VEPLQNLLKPSATAINGIRAALVSLEARTGVKIQYQDEEARKAGHG